MKKIALPAGILVVIGLTWTVTCLVFESPFAEVTVDYFAFFAGIFLAAEGLWRMWRASAPFFPVQVFRLARVIIGVCVFTIHLLQFMRK